MVRIKAGAVFGGDYVVVRELAKGGYGAVYVAEQKSTGRMRALKLMLPQLVDGEKARARFAREARIGARIRSPYLVEVLASGIDDDTDTPWLVMELLEGESLAQRLERVGRMSPADTLKVVREAGHALAEAHAQGIFHLDLKPENLFLARTRSTDGETETVKVLDFGIARIAAETRHSATVTSTVGSVLWMAPEQAAKGFKVSPASDVWALGLIVFRMLTGRYYWTTANVAPGEDIVSTEVLLELSAMPLASASERAAAVGADPATLPAGFDAWFVRSVNREATRRFAHAGEAVEALRAVLGGEVTSVPPTAPISDPPRLPGVGPHGTERVGVGWVPPPVHVPPPPPPPPASAKRAVWPVAFVGGLALATAVAIGSRLTRGGDRAHDGGIVDAGRVVPPPPRPTCPAGMVEIPAGRFTMGSPEGTGEGHEHPQHEVDVPAAFCMDRTEVTVAAYRACVADGHCVAALTNVEWPSISPQDRDLWSRFCNWRDDRAGHEDHPINCVDWTMARTFCATRRARLPTEAEWEYAARGSDGRTYPWGNEAPDETRLNACGAECVVMLQTLNQGGRSMYPGRDGFDDTAPVGRFPRGASPFGALDLAGNVWEWVEDTYDPTAYGARERGFRARVAVARTDLVNSDNRVLRGGGWINDVPSGVRASDRGRNSRSVRSSFTGFRCARDL